jgi:hypothetical protein
MMIKKLPNMLCTSQFFTAVVLSFGMQLVTGQRKTMKSSFAPLVMLVALSYTFGFIFTNYAISIGKSGSVLTVIGS